MGSPKVVVYAGPTISADEIYQVLPQAQVRPPVARGDLLDDDWCRGDTAVVIDGYFRERRSVAHKEILWLLSEGVDVIGAASMGALRAAEMAPYGMRGIGAVYSMYATGEVEADDEVAVLHGPAVKGYSAQTVAMVNLRYGCHEAAKTSLIAAATGERILQAAKSMPFIHRTWEDLAQALESDAHDPLRTLERMIGEGEWDLKRLDAMSALKAVGDPPRRPIATYAALTGIMHHQLLARRSRLDVLNAARLFDDDYPLLHEQVLTDLLKDFGGAKLGVEEGSDLPGNLASWLTEEELASHAPAEKLRLIMVRVWPTWQSVDWRPAVLKRLRESGNWDRLSNVVAQADEIAEQTRYRLVVPPPALCGKIFLRHWQSSPKIEMARRGFLSVEELGRVARRFFAFDVQRGRSKTLA